MSNEIRLTIQGIIENGYYRDRFEAIGFQLDQVSPGAHNPIVSVGEAPEVIPFGDIVTEGYLFLRLIEQTNYVIWGPLYIAGGTDPETATLVEAGRLRPGEPNCLRLQPGVQLGWYAVGGACQVDMRLWED